MLNFQKLDVYQCSIEFVALSTRVLDELPVGHSAIADQLRRASHSIPLNIAEGSGKTSPKEKKRFRSIARGSATECVAILDVLETLRVIAPTNHRKGQELLERVVKMLTKMSL